MAIFGSYINESYGIYSCVFSHIHYICEIYPFCVCNLFFPLCALFHLLGSIGYKTPRVELLACQMGI